jgi:hypothetical protein
MLRSRLLTFAAFVAAHAASSLVLLYGFAFQTGVPELFAWGLFIPWHLLGQTSEGHADLGALVGMPEDSQLGLVFVVSVNSLLWAAGAYGLWLIGRWAWQTGGRAGN